MQNYQRDEQRPKMYVTPERTKPAEPKQFPKYCAIVLNQVSKKRLMEQMVGFLEELPLGWKVDCDHLTLKMGGLTDEYVNIIPNTPVRMQVVEVGIMRGSIIAVRAEPSGGIESRNKIPHITITYNEAAGVKPRQSNDIVEWHVVRYPFWLSGNIKEIY